MYSPTSNRAVVWVGRRRLEIQQRQVVAPSDDEVLVKVMATGLCGSDCRNWKNDGVSRPLVLGHESSGVIEQVGGNIKDRFVGQRVAIEPGDPCRDCEFCLKGRPNICADLKYCGLDPTDGSLVQFYTCRAALTVPIPDNVSWEEAGAIQPLAVAVQVSRRAAFNIGQTMAIFGCGPLGLLILAVARAHGVGKIVMLDTKASRAEFAEKYGADVGICTPKLTEAGADGQEFAQTYANKIVSDHGVGYGFDVVVLACGSESAAQMAVSMVKAGGNVIQAGLGDRLSQIPFTDVTAKEVTITGVCRYTPGCFADAVGLISRKVVDLRPLVTSTYPLTKANDAFVAQHSRKHIKVIIMNQE